MATELKPDPMAKHYCYMGVGRNRRLAFVHPRLSRFRYNEQFRQSTFEMLEDDRASAFEWAQARRESGDPPHTWFDDEAHANWVSSTFPKLPRVEVSGV